MHCEIIDGYLHVFSVEIQLSKEKCFWAPVFGQPNPYTSVPNDLNMLLQNFQGQGKSVKNYLR